MTPKGEPHHDRVPDRRAVVPAASHAVHQESRHARHRRDVAHGRSGAVPQARRRLRLRHHGRSASAFRRTPGDSLRTYFSSQAARLKGSQNLAGIADPVDRCADRARSSPPKTRAAADTACKALDRVIRAGRYWVPHWYKASHWIAYWDVFGRPPTKPRYRARHSRKPGGTIATRRQSSSGRR